MLDVFFLGQATRTTDDIGEVLAAGELQEVEIQEGEISQDQGIISGSRPSQLGGGGAGHHFLQTVI
jgi:hypothetical protein